MKPPRTEDKDWGGGKNAGEFGEFCRAISKVKRDEDLKLLVFIAQKMSQKTGRSCRKSRA
jgi:hypothetical protein